MQILKLSDVQKSAREFSHRLNLNAISRVFLPQCVLVECVPKTHCLDLDRNDQKTRSFFWQLWLWAVWEGCTNRALPVQPFCWFLYQTCQKKCLVFLSFISRSKQCEKSVTVHGICWLSFTKEEFVCFTPDLWGAYITPLLVLTFWVTWAHRVFLKINQHHRVSNKTQQRSWELDKNRFGQK